MFLVAACALAAPSVLFRTAPKLSSAWEVQKAPLAASTPVTFIISMARDAELLAAAKTRIEEVANPESPDFREWLTPEETHTVAAPRKGALAAVSQWLVKSGIRGITRRAHAFEIRTTAGQVESLLNTHLVAIREVATGKTHRVAGDLHLPADVAPHVAAIYGLHGVPLPPRKPRAPKKIGDEPAVGPVELRQVYSVTKSRGSGSVKVRQAVAEFQGQYVQQSDLTDFFSDKTLVPSPKPGDDQIWKTIGDQGSGDGVEALLDVEYIMGVALGVKTEFWSFQQIDFCTDLKNWTTTMLADTADQPLVISVSYGWQGDLSQLGCTTDMINDIDNDFMQIAGVGITIVFSSGDSGSGWDGTQLWPEWPCSSTWITAVGSTSFTGAVGSQQQATTQFGSGSGFSTMFTASSWQTRAVTKYLATATGLPPASYFPATGRGTADVSALGENYKVYVDGSIMLVGGTSASAPCFAAQLSLINDDLIAAGKKPLGYLNPWLYSSALSGFTDITVGTDKIGRDGSTLDYGFDTAPGWDPPTGLGTPIWSTLRSLAFNKGGNATRRG